MSLFSSIAYDIADYHNLSISREVFDIIDTYLEPLDCRESLLQFCLGNNQSLFEWILAEERFSMDLFREFFFAALSYKTWTVCNKMAAHFGLRLVQEQDLFPSREQTKYIVRAFPWPNESILKVLRYSAAREDLDIFKYTLEKKGAFVDDSIIDTIMTEEALEVYLLSRPRRSNKYREAALLDACICSWTNMVVLLLEHGTDPRCINRCNLEFHIIDILDSYTAPEERN